MVYDSRFDAVQDLELDFYGDTMTMVSSLSAPNTYTVNLGVVDAAINASIAADAAEAQIDAQWLARVPVDLRDPNAVQIPTGDLPADPNPGRIFESPTVFHGYQLYRRLIPGFVYFNSQGTIKSVVVTHTREWHFFPTGRVLVRFKNYTAGLFYPTTTVDISESWGAYLVEPKPEEQDILHIYADNGLHIETDLGEKMEMTLEDGRRRLFWSKDYMIQSDWAAEQKTVPCQLPGNSDGGLLNVGVNLATTIPPDGVGAREPILLKLSGPIGGNFALSGISEGAGNLIIERSSNLSSPTSWEPLQTNSIPAGPFSFQIPAGTHASAYFRVRAE